MKPKYRIGFLFPKEVQQEIESGKRIEIIDELYAFFETYSS